MEGVGRNKNSPKIAAPLNLSSRQGVRHEPNKDAGRRLQRAETIISVQKKVARHEVERNVDGFE